MKWIFFIALGYCSGSIMYAYWLPYLFCHKDIIALSPDHNPGTANAFAYGGIWIGILVVICELVKGFLPVFLAAQYLNQEDRLFSLVMVSPVVGHAYPCFLWGRGGKSIAASFGSLLGLFPFLNPVLVLAALFIIFSVIIVINPHIYRTVITFLCFSSVTYLQAWPKPIIYGSVLISVLVIYRHFRSYDGEKLKLQNLSVSVSLPKLRTK